LVENFEVGVEDVSAWCVTVTHSELEITIKSNYIKSSSWYKNPPREAISEVYKISIPNFREEANGVT
jgi:hypothetical protein